MMVSLFLTLFLSIGQLMEPAKAVYGVARFEGKSYEETAGELKKLGVNAVFIKPDSGLVNAFHREGIRVWVEIPIFVGEAYWRSHPETRPVNSRGEPIQKREWYAGLCPTNPRLREHRLKEIGRVLGQFPIDGLWLDFIRYPCHWEVEEPIVEETCFCPNCLSEFQQTTGVRVPEGLEDRPSVARWILANHREEWVEWKCEQITSFVREAKGILKRARPNTVLGCFTLPWREEDHNNAIEKIIGQDFHDLKEWVDIFSPMVYHRMCGEPIDWIGEIVEYMVEATQKDVLPIVQASDVSEKELREAMKEAMSAPSKGVIIFSWSWLLKQGSTSTLKKVFGS